MPIDTPVPQETHVVARAIGGRAIPHDSPLWRTLFPGEHLRIDGRVATAQASKYMRDSLVSPAKELVAVTLTAEDEKSARVMQSISGFLMQKECVSSPILDYPNYVLTISPVAMGSFFPGAREGRNGVLSSILSRYSAPHRCRLQLSVWQVLSFLSREQKTVS